jgi:hypothetical protein
LGVARCIGRGGAEICFYYYIYNGGFLAPCSLTNLDKVELEVKQMFNNCDLHHSAFIVTTADSRGVTIVRLI